MSDSSTKIISESFYLLISFIVWDVFKIWISRFDVAVNVILNLSIRFLKIHGEN